MKKIHQVAEDEERVTLLQSKEVCHTYRCMGLIFPQMASGFPLAPAW